MLPNSKTLLFAVLATLAVPGRAADYSTSASGSATARCFAYPSQLVDSEGYGGAVPASSGSVFASANFADGNQFYNEAHATAASSASLGTLHALASGGGSINPASSSSFGIGTATARASFTDTMTLTSGSLPTGALVKYQVTVTLHANLQFLTASDSGKATISAMGNTMGLVRTGAPGEADVVTSIRTGVVGATVPLDATLTAQASGSAFFYYPHSNVQGEALVDASNTSVFTIKVLTAGAGYSTASGTTYQAVPEPASVAALAVGAVGLRRRRRG